MITTKLKEMYSRYHAMVSNPMPFAEVWDICEKGERNGLSVAECAEGFVEYLIWDASPKSAEHYRIIAQAGL